jgi:fibronectin type 3 domain-containing protein
MSKCTRNSGDVSSSTSARPHRSSEKTWVYWPKRPIFSYLATLLVFALAPCRADVPPPASTPPVPTDFCGVIYTELNTDLQAFNLVLATPPVWSPIPGGPTLYGATLQWANSNTGPQLSNPACTMSTPSGCSYLPTVQAELQEMKALGVQLVSIPALFPILYEPFYSTQTVTYQPYLTFYTLVAQAVHAAGLKLLVDSEITFSNDIQAGWTNMNTFYSSLTWPEYMAAKAQMAATIAQNMQPDYLVLANEPDTEAAQSGQTNLNIPSDAAAMVAGEIAAVKALNMPNPPKLGAGFGSWMAPNGTASLVNYINSYIALPLDYLDFHVLPVNTVAADNFLSNTITIASMAAAVGMPVAVSQAWLSKVSATEYDGYVVSNLDLERSRQPFSFWAPLDTYFLQTVESLASYTNLIYLDVEQSYFLSAYQTYGGTIPNGGSLNCTCTTASCSDYTIMQDENPLAESADQISVYTPTAFSYYNQLVTTPDTTLPSVPPSFTGNIGFTSANLSWGNSTDNIGVAGYNVLRCTPPALGQPCTGVWLANTTLPGYSDTGLTEGALYNYQVQAFDFANNLSPLSPTLSFQTYTTSTSSATNLVATVVSPQEIGLSWSAPSNPSGLTTYFIYAGTSPANLLQIASRPAGTTTYNDLSLAPNTTYYFGIVAVEAGKDAPMTPPTFATTLPLPPPPSSVTGTPSPTKIVLTWPVDTPQPNGLAIASYQIFQGTTSGDLTKAGSVVAPATTYTARSLTGNTTYYFEVQAVDTGHDDSPPSVQVAFTTLPLPAAPSNVAAAATSTSKVTVTWIETIPTGGLPIEEYTVYRGASPTTITTKLGTATKLTYTDTTAAAATTYYYGVEATDTSQDVSPMSAAAEATTPPVPAAPINVAAKATAAKKVTVTWTETVPTGGLPIKDYTIYRGASPITLTTKLGSATGLTYTDTTASPGTTYYYGVEATDSGMDVSPMSAAAEATTPPLPAAPTNVLGTPNSSTQITLTWSEIIPTGGLPVSSYTINWGTSPTSLTNSAKRTTLSFVDTGLTAATTYYFAVTATDSGGDVSAASATVSATTP